MIRIFEEVVSANAEYSKALGDKANLAMPPAHKFALTTGA
jgi:hypothetical protein